MAVQRFEPGHGVRRQAIAGGPVVEVVVGADAGGSLGVVDVTIPAGAAMPEHTHGDSETLLIPQSGRLVLVDAVDGTVTQLEPGVLATIPIGRPVRLENPQDTDARMLVVLAPPDFASALATWPEIA